MPSAPSRPPTSSPVIENLAWARIGPDLIFATGALLMLVFVGRAIWISRVRTARVAKGVGT